MRTEISSVELHYLLNELQILVDAKVDQIYQPEKEELILQFHKTGIGKLILRIIVGKYLYLTEHKGKNPEKPLGYCVFLRRRIKGMRLRELKQLKSERIVEMTFEAKDTKYKLILEFFNKGNIILADENNIIISPLELQRWADRTIRAKAEYTHPERINLFTLNKTETENILTTSTQDSLVKSLANDFGLGGIFAEEICLNTKIKKTIKPKDADPKIIQKAITDLLNREIKSNIVTKNKEVKDILPFELNYYKDYEKQSAESFNKALDSVLTEVKIQEAERAQSKEVNKHVTKTQKIIDSQNKIVKQLEKSIKENQEKGEALYNNYQLVEDLLKQIKEARKTMSWKEIKEKLKNHKIIKGIDEKYGKITVEI